MLTQPAKQKRKFLSLNIIILLVLLNLSLSFAEEVKFIYPPYDDSWGDAAGRLYPIHSFNGCYNDENKNTGEMFCMAYATGDSFGSADAWAVSNIYKDLIVDHNGKYVNHTGKYNITAHFHIQCSITACLFDIDSIAYSDAYIKLRFWIYDLSTESYISQKEKIVKDIKGTTGNNEHFFNVDQDIDIPINNINLIKSHSYQLIGRLKTCLNLWLNEIFNLRNK